MVSQLPDEKALEKMLTDLLGIRPTVRPLGQAAFDSRKSVVGEYRSADSRLLAVADLALANGAGAAITLIPAAEAEQNTKQLTMSETLFGNYREVLNVLGGLISVQNVNRVVLERTFLPPAPLPPEIAEVLAHPSASHACTIQLAKYGEGRLGFFAAPLPSA